MDISKGPYTNIDISWINAKFGTTADWLLKHIINNATYFKNFVAMKRRDNLNCCKNIKTKWPQNSWNRLRWVNSCDSGIDPRSRIFTKMIFLLLEISLGQVLKFEVCFVLTFKKTFLARGAKFKLPGFLIQMDIFLPLCSEKSVCRFLQGRLKKITTFLEVFVDKCIE